MEDAEVVPVRDGGEDEVAGRKALLRKRTGDACPRGSTRRAIVSPRPRELRAKHPCLVACVLEATGRGGWAQHGIYALVQGSVPIKSICDQLQDTRNASLRQLLGPRFRTVYR